MPITQIPPNMLAQPLTGMTPVATTSGTLVDFTGIPSWARRVTVLWSGVSFAVVDTLMVQLISTAAETTGYVSQNVGSTTANAVSSTALVTGFIACGMVSGTDSSSGYMDIALQGSNLWIARGTVQAVRASNVAFATTGFKTLGSALTGVRFTGNGGATFDAGTVSVYYE